MLLFLNLWYDSYQLGEVIGVGSFGKVMTSMNMATGHLMAVKQVPILNFEKSCHLDVYIQIIL